MRLGVHVSIGKGFPAALQHAQAIGCDGMQIFAGNPRGWGRKALTDSESSEFRALRQASGLWPLMVHLAYLPNLATADTELLNKSVDTLATDFERANRLGADFFVFHPGQIKGLSFEAALIQVSTAVNQVLASSNGSTRLLFENQAGKASDIAADFHNLGKLINLIESQTRVGVCFDTCHAFAAGYDLRDEAAWNQTLQTFDEQVGLAYLKIFHLNDSMGILGSSLDRHQHIGEGHIGLEGFGYLVNHPVLSKLPGILETPQTEPDDDLKNLASLRGLMKEPNS